MQPETAFPSGYFGRSYFTTGYFNGSALPDAGEGGQRFPSAVQIAVENDDDEVIMLAIQEFMRVLHG